MGKRENNFFKIQLFNDEKGAIETTKITIKYNCMCNRENLIIKRHLFYHILNKYDFVIPAVKIIISKLAGIKKRTNRTIWNKTVFFSTG